MGIGSSAVGDCQDSKTVSLCAKRVVEVEEEKWPLKHSNREVGEDKPDKAGTCFPDAKVYRGVCSNHICDMSEGDEVLITGPTGAEMLLPKDAHLHVRSEGHGVRHGGVLLAPREEGRRRMEGLREGDEEGPPLPRGGVLSRGRITRGESRGPVPRGTRSSPLGGTVRGSSRRACPAPALFRRGPLLPDCRVALSSPSSSQRQTVPVLFRS